MRLVGLYVAATCHNLYLDVVPHPVLEQVARNAFGPRLTILSAPPRTPDYSFSALGLWEALKRRRGHGKVIAPYHRTVLWNAETHSIKQKTKEALLFLLDQMGVILSPPNCLRDEYHGFAEVCAIDIFRAPDVAKLNSTCREAWSDIQTRCAVRSDGEIGADVAIFPSGTSQQFMPAEWAARWMPQAVFCFFQHDSRKDVFKNAGLKVKCFVSAEEIVGIGQQSRWTIATDSFPGHLLQLTTNNLTLCLTRESASRVVAPGFKGQVVHSIAPCSPCAGPTPDPNRCRAGLVECSTWASAVYSNAIVGSVLAHAHD